MAARLDDVLKLVPARLAASLIVAAAAVAGADARRAVSTMRRDQSRTSSPNAGWTMSAMAGALGVTLDKPAAYTLGAGPAPAPADIARAVRLLILAVALALPGIVALSLVAK